MQVRLSTANGQAVDELSYRYHPLPFLSDRLPASGTSLGGTVVTLMGGGFVQDQAGTNRVLFDGVPATNVLVADDGSLSCTSPPGPPGERVSLEFKDADILNVLRIIADVARRNIVATGDVKEQPHARPSQYG